MKVLMMSLILPLVALSASVNASYTPDNNSKVVWGGNIQIQQQKAIRHKKKKIRIAKKKRTRVAKELPWNMIKVKTVQGFYLTVHPAYAHKFLRLFEILAQNNINIPKEMVGCYSRRGHKPGSNHYIGAACDIQTAWNKTIPEMYHAGKWIKQAGLYDGCSFGDCGHVEAVRGLRNKAPNLYASLQKFKADQSTADYKP